MCKDNYCLWELEAINKDNKYLQYLGPRLILQ